MVNDFLIFKVKNILTNPAKAWETIHSENKSVNSLTNNLLLPLILLVSISAFAGSLMYTNAEMSGAYSILTGIKSFFLLFISVYATAFIHKEITYPLDLGKNFTLSFRLVSISLVPFLLCQVLSSFFESLLFINILALYGLYLFWTGSEKLLMPPAHKKKAMVIATFGIFVGVYIASNFLLSMIIDRIYFKFFA
jgi:hypothetical protein